MEAQKTQQYLTFYRDGLLNDTIPFWMKYTVDREYGGFLNYLDHDGKVLCTDKPVWAAGRFTWLMAMLYNNVEKKGEWLDTAKHGAEFLEKYCIDTDGRMFFRITRNGRPLIKRRYMYTETFGVLAFSEYAMASGDQSYMDKATDLFKLLLKYYEGGIKLEPKVFPETRQAKSHAMAMILLCVAQQMRKTGPSDLYEKMIDRSLKEVFEHFMRYDEKALLETVGINGERLDGPEGRCVNPGHAIETAWFIMEEYRHRKDKELLEKACLILDWSLELGWDEEFGGILYFVDVEGLPPEQYEHDMKLWWPHNEAIYACLLAYHLTGEQKYADWHRKIHDYAYSHFQDKKHGDWYKYLHRDGTISSTVKGNGWAGPFHLPRMQYNCWKLLEEMKKGL